MAGLDCGMKCLKFLLCVFNLVFWVSQASDFLDLLHFLTGFTFCLSNNFLFSFLKIEQKNLVSAYASLYAALTAH